MAEGLFFICLPIFLLGLVAHIPMEKINMNNSMKSKPMKPDSADFSLPQWLTVLAVIAATVLYKPFWPAVVGLLQNEWIKPIALGSFAAFVSWKWSVCYFERFRPFDDGKPETPDPCLRNPGDGSGAYFMAFLPGVILYKFWKTPVSWLLGRSKRHVARIYSDGSVGFDWVPIVLIAKWWVSGQLTSLPVGYCLSSKIMDRIRNRFEARTGMPITHSPQKEKLFFDFALWIFDEKIIRTEPYVAPVMHPNAMKIVRAMDKLNETFAAMDFISLAGSINNLATSANSLSTTVTNGSKRIAGEPVGKRAKKDRM